MPKVLVVDAVASQQESICRALQDAGFIVSRANDGDEVMKNVELHKPNLIVLDIIMEHVNGFDVLRELRENEKTKRIPVVVCSTKNTDFDKVWSLDLGADAYVTKPVDAEQLIGIVQGLI
ncbi:response regulator transcription factor [Pseudanabaena sp. PCC 6802]|uniref:response regulator transcription factor n=1 Tax=Pseudanabaena sp. PCC 6802 TaxID=118173 RepID=UPI00034AA029|nr:response regulator [Pseudanabaena sp. PCC 6802]